jgi:hypothetical protein
MKARRLRAVERLADTRFAMSQRAGVYDASRLLLDGGLPMVERQLRRVLLPASRAEPPSRLAHFFRHAKQDWVRVITHVCQRTLLRRDLIMCSQKGEGAEEVGGEEVGGEEVGGEEVGGEEVGNEEVGGEVAADARVVRGLGVLTLLFVLHPPSVRWVPVETSLAAILRAEGGRHEKGRSAPPPRARQRVALRLAMVDCVLALCVARVRARRYDQEEDDDDDAAGESRLPDRVERVLKRTFESLVHRCSYRVDQEAVFGAAQRAKQQANIQASLGALDVLKGALS